jgi:hypothetical protein
MLALANTTHKLGSVTSAVVKVHTDSFELSVMGDEFFSSALSASSPLSFRLALTHHSSLKTHHCLYKQKPPIFFLRRQMVNLFARSV